MSGQAWAEAPPATSTERARHCVPAVNYSPDPSWSHFPTLPVPLGLEVSTSPPHDCAYLPGKVAVTRGFRCGKLPGWLFQALLDAGFRRSGSVLYQMACPGCRACVPLRVPVAGFVPTRGQRRILRRNRDVVLTLGEPELSGEKLDLYARYLAARHDGQMSGESEELADFLYRSPADTLEMCYREPGGRLLGVGICDLTSRALSSVYFYFSPDAGGRGLGFYSMMTEIGAALSLGMTHYYPGFWLAECPKMSYKSRLGPNEVLGTDGQWRPNA